MKKILSVLLLSIILSGNFALFSCGEDDRPTITGYFFNIGEFLEGASGSVIITHELYPIVTYTEMSNISGNENLFEDLRTGDKIKIIFSGDILKPSPPIIFVYGYELIERGSIENIIETVPEDIWERWKGMGWIDGIINYYVIFEGGYYCDGEIYWNNLDEMDLD